MKLTDKDILEFYYETSPYQYWDVAWALDLILTAGFNVSRFTEFIKEYANENEILAKDVCVCTQAIRFVMSKSSIDLELFEAKLGKVKRKNLFFIKEKKEEALNYFMEVFEVNGSSLKEVIQAAIEKIKKTRNKTKNNADLCLLSLIKESNVL